MSEEVKVKRGTLDDLIPDDRNMNRHSSYGMSLIEKSIRKNKFGRSILVDKNGRIIGGNGVTETAMSIGETKTIVVETTGDELVVVKRTDVDLDSKEGREMALADNATAVADIEWDAEAVKEIEGEFEISPEDWGVVLEDSTGSYDEDNVTEDDFDPDENYETKVKRGEVWQLGEHRLMCGDSLNEADVLKLLNGEHAPLTFTDPPYRLDTFGGGVYKQSSSMQQVRENKVDQFEPSKLKLYSETNIYSHNKPLIKDYILLAEREGKPYDLAIYKKQGLPNYAGHLMTDLEYIAVIGDQGPKKGLDFETYSKLYVGKKDADNELSYSKPVALCGKFIMLYSDEGDIILDLFGGSGSTMIACEQLGRKCFMMELDPKYCSIIIARWEKLTGKKAEMVA